MTFVFLLYPRILTVNVFPLAFWSRILYLDEYRDGLIGADLDALEPRQRFLRLRSGAVRKENGWYCGPVRRG